MSRLKRRPHRHSDYRWDGYFSHCKCGACSGDRINPQTGLRCISFKEWEEGEEGLEGPPLLDVGRVVEFTMPNGKVQEFVIVHLWFSGRHTVELQDRKSFEEERHV